MDIALLTGGAGVGLLLTEPAPGYAEAEYRFSGAARSYRSVAWPADGRFVVEPVEERPFATRVLVRRPDDPAAFNGTLVVEWLNVSGGLDGAPEYIFLVDELVRRGYAYAGVSAQYIGVEGGTSLVGIPGMLAMKDSDPDRYGTLRHPGDAFSYDLFTQVGSALRDPATEPLSGLDVRTMLAVGDSQSAITLTTYVNAVSPLEKAFDGYLLHSRAGSPGSLGEADAPLDLLWGWQNLGPVPVRDDVDVPVLLVQTEGDLIGALQAIHSRQPDSAMIRTWEVAGSAHGDRFIIPDAMAQMMGCPDATNDGQQRFVLRAGLRWLNGWARGEGAPPQAAPLVLASGTDDQVFATDDLGNALGGVRTPCVDVAVEVLSGTASPGASLFCQLMGRTTVLPDEVLAARYSSPEDYLHRYEQAVDACIAAGFALEDDRAELLADARAHRLLPS